MRIPYTNIHILTGGQLQKRIKAAANTMNGDNNRQIHNLIIDKARLLFERAELIKTINILRKPKKPDSQN